jgi:hypothetical protein
VAVSDNRGRFLPKSTPARTEWEAAGEKIEQYTSQSCLKSEYLTLLNSFRVLQDFDCKAPEPAAGGFLSCQPPKAFNEKELYGR